MASRTSSEPGAPDPDGGLRRVSHRQLAEKIARRKAELGDVDVPRNSGKRRTASKRALLKAIEDIGGKW